MLVFADPENYGPVLQIDHSGLNYRCVDLQLVVTKYIRK